MSRISQDFINSVGYLYEEINTQQNDFLNEESQYYDAEAAELVEDILATISTSMIYEGYSVESIIGFLADSSEQDIIEKYLSFDETILAESVVDEEYIEERFQQLNEIIGAALRIAGAGLKAAKYAKGAKGLAPLTRLGSGLQGAGKAASRVAQQGTKASAVVRPALSKGVQKVKDIAQGAKKALPGIAKVAGMFGLGAAGGYVGAKMGGAGSESKSTGSQRPPASADAPAAPSTPGSRTPSTPGSRTPSKPTSKDTARPGETPMQQWARLHPDLAAKVKPGQSGYEEISKTRVKPGPYEKKDQTPTQGPSTAQIDTADVDAAMKAEQERQKKRLESQKTPNMTAKESYEPYDIVLNYLLSEGHADTLDEANYIMLEMDENAICTIVEEYEDYLLAEEIQEWVNSLLDEGYDLSEYTWDDMVEYYVTEARVDAGKTDDEKREARKGRGNSSFMNILSRRMKKSRGKKPLDEPGKNRYSAMQHDKKQAQRERDADEQRSRDRGGMSRGTWDKD